MSSNPTKKISQLSFNVLYMQTDGLLDQCSNREHITKLDFTPNMPNFSPNILEKNQIQVGSDYFKMICVSQIIFVLLRRSVNRPAFQSNPSPNEHRQRQ